MTECIADKLSTILLTASNIVTFVALNIQHGLPTDTDFVKEKLERIQTMLDTEEIDKDVDLHGITNFMIWNPEELESRVYDVSILQELKDVFTDNFTNKYRILYNKYMEVLK